MRLNRREFVRTGAIGAAGIATASCDSISRWYGNPVQLDILIKGLVLLQRAGQGVTVHLIDGTLVNMGVHEPRLIVPTALVDSSSTVACVQHPTDSNKCVIDLTDKIVSIPGTGSAPPNVTQDDSAIASDVPPAGQWKSFRYTARLNTLCGATQITDTSKFYGSVQINHGHLECGPPESPIGATTVWTFKDPNTGQAVAPAQALSDVVFCRTRVHPSGTTFMIGNQTLVLNGNPGEVTVSNAPPEGTKGHCTGGQTKCIEHLNALFALVNATVIPVGEGDATPALPDADPNYCPPGSI